MNEDIYQLIARTSSVLKKVTAPLGKSPKFPAPITEIQESLVGVRSAKDAIAVMSGFIETYGT